LVSLLGATPWFMEALHGAKQLDIPCWAIGAGAIRNRVWDHLHGRPDSPPSQDVDLVWYDPASPPGVDRQLEGRLRKTLPAFRWEVVNQAHLLPWRAQGNVNPALELERSIATWPETATAVAVTLDATGCLQLIAPFGLDDLFSLRLRRNPACPDPTAFDRRLADKQFLQRWPKLTLES
jgi:hypothetical protein